MNKPVKSVIASARVLIRRPSEVKLPTDDMRFLLHQIVEELHASSIKENSDFFTHDLEIALTYNDNSKGYTFVIDSNPEGVAVNVTDVIPVFLRFQDTNSDPDEDTWYKVRISKLTTFDQDVAPGQISIAMLGNSWQGVTSPQFKINQSQEWVADQRWRICGRLFPSSELLMLDTVPFLGEFTSLVETMLAVRSMPLVKDDSASWKGFMAMQMQVLMGREAEGKQRLREWLYKDVENRIITNRPYDYRTNNALASSRTGRIRAQWP